MCSVVAGAASAVVMAAYTQLRYLPFFVYNCVVALINNMTLIMALLIVWCNKNFIFYLHTKNSFRDAGMQT